MEAKTTTQERIMTAAVQLFSHRGFSGTTTKDIARLADVNEGTLFRYFHRKVDLFWAAVESEVSKIQLGRQLQNALDQGDHPVIVLPLICAFLVKTVYYQPELMRLLHFSVLEMRPTAERVFRKEMVPLLASIRRYLDVCVQRGVVVPVDTYMTTIALVTSVIAHQGSYGLITGNSLPYANADDAAAVYANYWINVLLKKDDVACPSFRPPTFFMDQSPHGTKED